MMLEAPNPSVRRAVTPRTGHRHDLGLRLRRQCEPESVRRLAAHEGGNFGIVAVLPQTNQQKNDCKRAAILKTYQNSVTQSIKSWKSAQSWGSRWNAWFSYDYQPTPLKAVGWGSGAWNEVAPRAGLKAIPGRVTGPLFAFSTVWSALDGFYGLVSAQEAADNRLQSELQSAVDKYWKDMGELGNDCK